MKFPRFALLTTLTTCLVLLCSSANGQYREDQTVKDANQVLNEIMAIPVNGIPQNMLRDAHAVAIIPDVIKGSFVVGARHGNGVLLVRDAGGWHAPVFITLTGGNVGWQVGVQSTDVILVFKTRRSVENLLSGKFTLGADAAVAAGPVGRNVAAATDANLGAQILSYSRSRGIFVGVSLDGSVIRMNPMSNAAYYRAATQGGPVVIPPSAQALGQQVIYYAGNSTNPSSQVPATNTSQAQPQTTNQAQQAGWRPTSLAQQHSMQEVDHLRDQLARLAPELYKNLDTTWQQYLGLPAQIFQGNGHPSQEVMNQCLARFEAVKNDSRYAALANHPEFQSTYGLLKHYQQELFNIKQTLNLPAPPSVNATSGNR